MPGRAGDRPMPDIRIYQIFYSRQTREGLDPGFIGLDNLANERPDWREYWPIRRFLRDAPPQEDAYYGFLSPKFGATTNLSSAAVRAFVAAQGGAPDVILFSPYFDQIAFPVNIFEQGAVQHPDTLETFRECVEAVAPGVDFGGLVMDSSNTVFCNYFVARRAFWDGWLERCEIVYRIAEEGATGLARRLNASTAHDGAGAPTKVFVIERIASLMLATDRRWAVAACNPIALPWSGAPIAAFRMEVVILDALKMAYAAHGHAQYLEAFHRARSMVDRALQIRTAGPRAP
jgi:hypothetical protein